MAFEELAKFLVNSQEFGGAGSGQEEIDAYGASSEATNRAHEQEERNDDEQENDDEDDNDNRDNDDDDDEQNENEDDDDENHDNNKTNESHSRITQEQEAESGLNARARNRFRWRKRLNESANVHLKTDGSLLRLGDLIAQNQHQHQHHSQLQGGLLLCRAANKIGWQRAPCITLLMSPGEHIATAHSVSIRFAYELT